MTEELPQPMQESRELTTTETLDQLLGSGIVAFVSKDGEHLPVFEGRWESLPTNLGLFFEGLDAYLEKKELGAITTINIYFGKNSQRTELEGILPYGMILTRKALSDFGKLVVLNFTQYNIDGNLLKNFLDDSSDLFAQLMSFFPQCETKPKIELVQFLRPVVVDAFREGHLKEIVQQTTGSSHFKIAHELVGDLKQLPWGMGGACVWDLKTLQGSDEQTIPPLVTFILDRLDQFNLEFNRYMSIQERTEFLEQIIETVFESLKTFVGTPFMWLEQIEKTVNAIQCSTKQEKRMLNFFRNELKRYIAKVTVPSIITIYTDLLHEEKGLDPEFDHIDAFGAYLQQTLMDALDVGALVPDDPRIYVSTQISSIWTEFRKNAGLPSRGVFSGLITKTLESVRTFDLPQIVLDSGYLMNSVTNILIQWSRGAHKKILDEEAQLTEQENVLEVEQNDLDARHQVLSERTQAIGQRREKLSSDQEQLNSKEAALNTEKNALDSRESDLNTEKTTLEAEEHAILQANQELANTAEHLAIETQKLAEKETTLTAEKGTAKRKLQTLIANHEKLTAEKQAIEDQCGTITKKGNDLSREKEELTRQLSALTAYREGLASETDKLMDRLQSLDTSQGALTTEKQAIAQQLRSLTEQISSIAKDKEKIEQQLQNLANDQEALVAEKKKLENRLATLRTTEGASLTENEEIAQQLQALLTKQETLVAEKSKFEGKHKTLATQEATLTAEKEELTLKVGSLSAEENKLVANKTRVDDHQQSVIANQTSLNTEKTELERQLDILNKNQESVAIEKTRLEDQLQRVVTQIESNQSQQDSLTEQAQALDAQLSAITEQRRELNTKVGTLEQERRALDERSRLLKTQEATWNANITQLHEAQNQWASNFETWQSAKLELESAFSILNQDKKLLDEDYSSWNADKTKLLDKKTKLEQEKTQLEQIQTTLEKYIELLGQKIAQEYGDILLYELRKIRELSRKFRDQLPTYFEEISNSGQAERVGEEWTVQILEELSNEFEITCEFEELKEHMKYWASPVGGIYPQRIELFFTDSHDERTGDTLFIFQNQKSRFSKRMGAVLAKEKIDGDLLLRDLRDRCRQMLAEHDSETPKEVGV